VRERSREGGMKRRNEKIGERNANRTENVIGFVTTRCRTISTVSNTISTRGWSISWFGKRLISCVHNI
jgi:hypothetical protein